MEPAGVRAGRAGAHGREHAAGPSNEPGANGRVNYSEEHHRPVASFREPPAAAAGAGVFLCGAGEPWRSSWPLRCFIDPDDPAFTPPGDILARVREYCAAYKGYAYRKPVGEVMRCIYESLALKYRFALGQLEAAMGRRFAALHAWAAAQKTAFKSRMTADATGLAHSSRPGGGHSWRNILIQLVALACCRPLMRDGGLLQKQNV